MTSMLGVEEYQASRLPVPIKIRVDGTQSFLIPSKGCLRLEGCVKKKDGSLYTAQEITTIASKLMHAFSRVSYSLDDLEIDAVKNPGQCVSMVRATKHSCDVCSFDSVCGSTFVRAVENSSCDGSFVVDVPLSHLFGFCEDFKGSVFGYRHQIELDKTYSFEKQVFWAANIEEGSLHLDKICIKMQHAVPDSSIVKGNQTVVFRSRSLTSYGKVENRIDGFNTFEWPLDLSDFRGTACSILIAFESSETVNSVVVKNIRLNGKTPNSCSIQLLPYQPCTVFPFDESLQTCKLQTEFCSELPNKTIAYALVRHSVQRVI